MLISSFHVSYIFKKSYSDAPRIFQEFCDSCSCLLDKETTGHSILLEMPETVCCKKGQKIAPNHTVNIYWKVIGIV